MKKTRKTGTILGIDPGTRFVGIAVMRSGTLVHHQVRSFQGVWTYKKMKKIILWIGSIMTRYEVTQVAIKIPDVFPSSPHYNQLIGSLNIFCPSRGIHPCYYQLSEIKDRQCPPDNLNMEELMRVMLRKHPELMPEYQREQRNKNAHYYKIFTAVAVTKMQSTKVA